MGVSFGKYKKDARGIADIQRRIIRNIIAKYLIVR